jgi:hypothetical protein
MEFDLKTPGQSQLYLFKEEWQRQTTTPPTCYNLFRNRKDIQLALHLDESDASFPISDRAVLAPGTSCPAVLLVD